MHHFCKYACLCRSSLQEEYEEEMTWSTDVPYSITIDRQTGIEIYPTLITKADIKDI